MSGGDLHALGHHDHGVEHPAQHARPTGRAGPIAVVTPVLATTGALGVVVISVALGLAAPPHF